MELFQIIWGNIVPFVAVLTVLVFVHELGHYYVARRCGVRVEVFSIGFGPEIFGWNDASGTRWKFSWIPLGGYVRMFSDLNAASMPDQTAIAAMSDEDKSASLFHKTVGQRMAVSVAGPAANYIFAILLLGGLYMISGQRLPSDAAKIGQVMPNSAADIGGLRSDDTITHINGGIIHHFSDMQSVIQKNPGIPLTVSIMRDDAPHQLTLTPDSTIVQGTAQGRLGITQGADSVRRPFWSAFFYAAADTWSFTVKTLHSLGQVITGKQSADGLSGPIGIASLAGKIAQKSYGELFWFAAFLSINLGLINLFPVPMLDGGHILLYAIEGIRGKPVSEKAQEIAFRIGFACIMALVLFSTWNDLAHLKVIDFIKRLF